jgi:polar amino acid transport system substrate-binding protein
MKKSLPLIIAALAVLSMIFVMGGCQKKADADKDAADMKTYVFASDATWPPMEYVDDKGDIVGFDMDLLAAVAAASGFKYEVQNTGWDGIFAGLANGAYDAIISSVTITDERKAEMDFSKPYINAGQILVVPAGYKGGDKLSDFAGKSVGVQQGTTGDFAVEAVPSITRKAFDEVGLAIEDMINGNLAAVVCDSVTAIDFVAANESYKGKLEILGEPFTEEEFGIAVKKGNTELMALLNDGLDKVIADGTQAKLVDKWLR